MRRFAPADLVSEVLLVAVTITAVLGFDRMFDNPSYRGPLITTALVTHGVLILTRRVRGGVALALLTSAVAFVLQVTWSLFGSTSQLGIPTRDTLDALSVELRGSWDLFNQVQAPAPPAVGFLLAASLAVWAVAFLSDWAAFRLRTSGEALVPAFATIVFIALIGVPEGRTRHVALFMAAAIVFLLAHRAAARVNVGIWLGGKTGSAYGSLMAGGSVIALVALVAGLLGGPALPGAKDEPLVDWRQVGAQGPTSRIAISPLIDIRSRLVNQPDLEAFIVETDSPGYWRAMALDSFNGTTWTLAADFREAEGTLENVFPVSVPSDRVEQTFTITGLDMDWLPAAYRPVSIDVPLGQKVTFEASLSTLILDEEIDPAGMVYSIVSDRPAVTPELIANRTSAPIDERYTALPDDMPASIGELAANITAGIGDDYGKALALQNFFRSGEFTYSLARNPGHDENAMLEFLANRVGYCEQFAGTFAAMARSVGLPTRIAVGFTDGEQDPSNPRLYRVSGKHAHSWPEVYIEGAGWLLFEPTPGRGAGEAAAYTGFQRQQVGEVAEAVAEGAEVLPNPTAGVGEQQVEQRPEDRSQFDPGLDEPQDPASDPLNAAGDTGFQLGRGWTFTGLALLAFIAYALAVPALKRRKRAAERALAADERARVRVAWRHATADLTLQGVRPELSETEIEFSARAARQTRLKEVAELGQLASDAAYNPQTPSPEVAAQAEAIEDTVRSTLSERTRLVDKAVDGLDPRPLLTRR